MFQISLVESFGILVLCASIAEVFYLRAKGTIGSGDAILYVVIAVLLPIVGPIFSIVAATRSARVKDHVPHVA